MAVWQKGEGKFTNAWHSLGEAIREAQEIGLTPGRYVLRDYIDIKICRNAQGIDPQSSESV